GQESREDPEPGPTAPEPQPELSEPQPELSKPQPQQPEPVAEQAVPEPPVLEEASPDDVTREPESGPPPVEADDAWLASLDASAESAAAEADGVDDYTPEPVVEPPLQTEQAPVPAEPQVESLPESGEFVWEQHFRSLGIVGMPGNLASNAAMTRHGDEIILTIDEGHARLLNTRHEEKIVEALRKRFGDTITLRVEQGDAGQKTPAAWEERQRRARQKAAEEAIRNDPAVQSIVERFEARVVEQSIRPV
ncbi:MAG: DNA polymerase III subunit gamma/tau C-terminal domain-containing protein, partial [Marinobacter sp.]|nr:DNA polymerase III subunit gamma/tau C-terminal domain-containing protein [Marinobacter sp.]